MISTIGKMTTKKMLVRSLKSLTRLTQAMAIMS